MPTNELENELRGAFARAAADIPDTEQTGQRLLKRNYRPGGSHRRWAATAAGLTAAAAVTLGLGVSGAFAGSSPAAAASTIRTAAFVLVKHANGTATLTLNSQEVVEPSILQSDLQQDGIPAIVTTGSSCTSDPEPAGFSQAVQLFSGVPGPPYTVTPQTQIITINPAAMPSGTELSFANFQTGNSAETYAMLIASGTYTCSTNPPASLAGGGFSVFLSEPSQAPSTSHRS